MSPAAAAVGTSHGDVRPGRFSGASLPLRRAGARSVRNPASVGVETRGMSRRDVAERMGEAAGDLLASLDDEQRALAAWPFPADDERRRGSTRRPITAASPSTAMRPAQQRPRCGCCATGLSAAGVRHGDDDHRAWRTCSTTSRAGQRDVRAASAGRDPGMYYVRVFGEPAPAAPWGWRFGGHHVSINHTVVDGELVARRRASSAPTRPPRRCSARTCCGRSAGAEDLGRELVRSLDAGQLAARALLLPVRARRPRRRPTGPRVARAIGRCRSRRSGGRRSAAELGEQDGARPGAPWSAAVGLRPEHVDAVSSP